MTDRAHRPVRHRLPAGHDRHRPGAVSAPGQRQLDRDARGRDRLGVDRPEFLRARAISIRARPPRASDGYDARARAARTSGRPIRSSSTRSRNAPMPTAQTNGLAADARSRSMPSPLRPAGSTRTSAPPTRCSRRRASRGARSARKRRSARWSSTHRRPHALGPRRAARQRPQAESRARIGGALGSARVSRSPTGGQPRRRCSTASAVRRARARVDASHLPRHGPRRRQDVHRARRAAPSRASAAPTS